MPSDCASDKFCSAPLLSWYRVASVKMATARGMNGTYNLKLFHDLEREGMLAVLQFCMNEGLIASRYECPECKEDMRLVERKDRKDGYTWSCRKSAKNGVREHYIKRSVRKGSWFEESKLSIIDVLSFTILWVNGACNDVIENEVGVSSSETLADWNSFCREICVDVCGHDSEMIGGVGKVVEVDESMFGKRKYNRGKRVKGTWVFGGVERGSNKCFIKPVESRGEDVLCKFVRENVLPGTLIVSDCWKGYVNLDKWGYTHETVNHSQTFKDPVTGAHTNTIEGLWSLIKSEFRSKHHRNVDNLLDSYFAEFMWRRKYKSRKSERFSAFLEGIKKVYPPQEKDPDPDPTE